MAARPRRTYLRESIETQPDADGTDSPTLGMPALSVSQAIAQRKSCRHFLARQPAPDDVVEILRLASRAPSGVCAFARIGRLRETRRPSLTAGLR
eukprot:5617175-Prymnesium_polylepis.1